MTEEEKAIRQVIETWIAASTAGDLASVLDLMTEDVIFMVPGREPFGKQVFAQISQGMAPTQMDGTCDIVELHVLGDWAFVRTRIDMTAATPGGGSVRRFGYTLTLLCKETDGRWRLARDANLLSTRS